MNTDMIMMFSILSHAILYESPFHSWPFPLPYLRPTAAANISAASMASLPNLGAARSGQFSLMTYMSRYGDVIMINGNIICR